MPPVFANSSSDNDDAISFIQAFPFVHLPRGQITTDVVRATVNVKDYVMHIIFFHSCYLSRHFKNSALVLFVCFRPIFVVVVNYLLRGDL